MYTVKLHSISYIQLEHVLMFLSISDIYVLPFGNSQVTRQYKGRKKQNI